MATDTRAIVEALYGAWRARDLPSMLTLMADDIVFALHIPADVVPIGGETKGKVAVAAALQGLLDAYEFVAYDPSPVDIDGSKATAEVQFRYRCKATGEIIDSRMRHQWVVDGGKAERLDEWHDLPKVRAFFDRVALRVASKSA